MNHLTKRVFNHALKSTRWITPRAACLGTSPTIHPSHTTPYFIANQFYELTPSRTIPSPISKPRNKMPPNHKATAGKLETFILPDKVEDNPKTRAMAAAMIKAWQKTSIFQIQMTQTQQESFRDCIKASRDFFKLPFEAKSQYVDDQSFSGYIASGEELTAGIADYSEIFTVTKDLLQSDSRVQSHWPCHGPCPWPNETYKDKMTHFMDLLGDSGEKLLQLTSLGLGLKNIDAFKEMTNDGWHHMRNLRFPGLSNTNGKTKKGRGIGSHTDYGLFVIAAPDLTGGDFVRPRLEGESIKEWQTTAAGASEDDNDEKWLFVLPVENTMTVFPGDMMQFLTNGFLPATPHKVALNTSERYAFAYFHEPNFNSVIETLPQFHEKIHYGSHFTKQFMNNYPTRITAKRINTENRLDILGEVRNRALASHKPNSLV